MASTEDVQHGILGEWCCVGDVLPALLNQTPISNQGGGDRLRDRLFSVDWVTATERRAGKATDRGKQGQKTPLPVGRDTMKSCDHWRPPELWPPSGAACLTGPPRTARGTEA